MKRIRPPSLKQLSCNLSLLTLAFRATHARPAELYLSEIYLSPIGTQYLLPVPAGPTVSNRDMGELMSRDPQFGKGVAHKGLYKRPMPEELDANKPLVIVPEGGTKSGSIYTSLTSKDHFCLLEILPGTDKATL